MSEILKSKESIFREKTGYNNRLSAGLEMRMYGFSPFHLKPIQAGIQYEHATNEYKNQFKVSNELKRWSYNDKTTVLLSVACSTDDVTESFYKECIDNNVSYNMLPPSLTRVKLFCDMQEINHMSFFEPDLNYMETSVCILLDERVWNKIKYPDEYWANHIDTNQAAWVIRTREFIFSHALFA